LYFPKNTNSLALLTCLPVGWFARGSVNLEEKKMLFGFAASSSREKRDLFTLRQAPRILYKTVMQQIESTLQ
jgi:hypothetical protein